MAAYDCRRWFLARSLERAATWTATAFCLFVLSFEIWRIANRLSNTYMCAQQRLVDVMEFVLSELRENRPNDRVFFIPSAVQSGSVCCKRIVWDGTPHWLLNMSYNSTTLRVVDGKTIEWGGGIDVWKWISICLAMCLANKMPGRLNADSDGGSFCLNECNIEGEVVRNDSHLLR